MSDPGELWVLRHGETEWSRTGRHTGGTDVPLTPEGEAAAAAWAPVLGAHPFAAVWSSPLARARRTADLAGLAVTEEVSDLREWDYGSAEGRTTAELREERPGWDVWRDAGTDGTGERLEALAARADGVLTRAAPLLERGDVALVAHGHVLRVLAARWCGLEPAAGALLRLDAACLGVLGRERERRVVHRWGLQPGGLPGVRPAG